MPEGPSGVVLREGAGKSDAARSFSPLAGPGAHTLILGSMPGLASLHAGRYYAHPRNGFWPIMGALFQAGPELDYSQRADRLIGSGIAVWDVLASCIRPGSLDSSIKADGLEANDFSAFLAMHPAIDRLFFNGQAAEGLFRRHVIPRLAHLPVAMTVLPSTSPAYASLTLMEKLQRWTVVLPGQG